MGDRVAASLWARARGWRDEDPDPETRAELTSVLDAHDEAGLADRFASTLTFGTAGLRAELGAGPNRMNRAVVMRASSGLAQYVTRRGGHRVVVGFDARRKSDVFARDAAAVLRGAGLEVLLMPRALPTPLVAFAVRALGCDAGAMITASHNPPRDNGYKVYLADGRQIVSPADAEIAAAMDRVANLADIPCCDWWQTVPEDVIEAYVRQVAALVSPTAPRDVRIVYTPMHGVGRDVFCAVLRAAGFAQPEVVPEQAEPDANFPTVPFPNPEEPGALDLALALAEERRPDVLIAHDPDADRCAAAVNGRTLRGDELGVLLGWHLLRRAGSARQGSFATTIVSSSLLGKLAAKGGVDYVETLTGFKWLSRVPNLRYGYEEALGYCVAPNLVGDKDGMSAGLLLAELVAVLKAEGKTLFDVLDELALEFGLHAVDQLTVRTRDSAVLVQRLRAHPPTRIETRRVVEFEDLEAGAGGLPPTLGLRMRLEGNARVVVRPSGTEPKLKCYLELVLPVHRSVTATRERARCELEELKRGLQTAIAQP
jgi:phosphomannomutase